MSTSRKERDNILVWDGEKRGHYEVYYLKWNDLESRTAYWVRYTMTSPPARIGDPYCELWGIFFDVNDPGKNFAVKNRYPIDRLSWDRNKFHIKIADAELSMNSCRGKIADDAKGLSLEWELEFDSPGGSYYFFPSERFYTGSFPKTKGISPHQNARFSGRIVASGREIKFDGSPGQQTHLWGEKHALRWAWGHCNTFKEDPDTVWEGIDSQIKLGPVPSPHFKIFYLKTDGAEYHFNSPVEWFVNKSRWKLCQWTFECKKRDIRMVGQITSRPRDHVAVTYTDPDGELLWCNNSKVADMKLAIYDGGGGLIKELHSEAACAAEYVDRKTYPEVPVRI